MENPYFKRIQKKILINPEKNISARLVSLQDLEMFTQFIQMNREYLSEWIQWINRFTTESDIKKIIEQSIVQRKLGRELVYLIYSKNSMMGTMTFHFNQILDPGHTKLSYMFGRHSYSQEQSLTILKKIIGNFFKLGMMDYISIDVQEKNDKGKSIPIKLHFRHVGYKQLQPNANSQPVTYDIYSISRFGWVQFHGIEG